MGQLYINGRLMDFSDKTTVAMTKQINDIGSIDKVKGDTTNQFKLPATQNNMEALGLPGDVSLSAGQEYRLLPAKYIENGVEVIPVGQASIEAVNEFIEVKILSGNVEFFDLLDGSIKDLFTPEFEAKFGLPSLDHAWNRATILASLSNTSGYIYPIVDYGNLVNNNRLVDCRAQRPAVFVHTIVDRIIKRTGFKPVGDVFSDPDFLNEILPFSGEKLEQPDKAGGSFVLKTVKTDSQFNLSNQFFQITMPNAGVDNNGGSWENNRYTFKKSGTVKLSVKILAEANTGKPTPFTIGIQKNGQVTQMPGIGSVPVWISHGTGSVVDDEIATLEFQTDDIPFDAGDYLQLWGFRNNQGFHRSFYIQPGSFFQVLPGIAYYNSQVSIKSVLPDHSIKDFLKNWMYRFCVIVQTDNLKKTVSFRSFADLVGNIQLAKDWSDKLDAGSVAQREFSIGSYAQVNTFAMKEDETVPEGLGTGSLAIDDQTLAASKTVVTSIYAASETVYRLQGYPVAKIAKISAADLEANKVDFTVKTEQRILRIIRMDNDAANPVVYHQGDTADKQFRYVALPFTYFNNQGLANGLGFDQILATRYVELAHTLRQSKRITESIRLNETDIAEFDFFVPVFLRKHAAYFYVNKINNYQDGIPTKVELIRL
ncbi:hypothetical protein [Pedobacter sp. SYP-B3415]|uniref:hypothetical protein n=1 Tax=Pedobacter sp. SYP-B3415 TaxID=2496641 RepID=UPI00101B8836|nr:hypothetical protein [Pedobacter sp. SYP-B3415]